MKALIWAAVSTRRQTDEDKFSLPRQEEDGLELIAKEGWSLVEVLRVPGHTRSKYTEFHKLAAAANKKGIDAFLRLQEHWEARDFDVLIIRDGDRLARAQGVMGTVVESIIQGGARIYCLADGWVDKSNYRMWISMVGYRAAVDIDKLKGFIDEGANKRAERGLPVGSSTLWSHKLIRAENGRAMYQMVDPDKKLFFQDAATLILEGVSWYTLEEELFKRFGHAKADGKPHPPRKIYNLLYNPGAWGHTARFFRDMRKNAQFKGAWAYDPTVEPPAGVVMFYNAHQPIYEGDLADQIKQEMRRRESIVRGKTRAETAEKFSGLLICGECGCNLIHHVNHRQAVPWQRWYCFTKHRRLAFSSCSQSKGLPDRKVTAFVQAKLKELLETQDLDRFLGIANAPPQNILELLEEQIDNLEAQARRLIQKQMSAPEAVSTMYDEQIQTTGDQLRIARQRLQAESRSQRSNERRTTQVKALREIRDLTLTVFWDLPPNVINQKLHALMGKRRWVVLEGEIIAQQDAPPRRRH